MSSTTDDPRLVVEPAAVRAWAEGRMIYFELHDGRIVGFPADRFRILAAASEATGEFRSKSVGMPCDGRGWTRILRCPGS